MAIEELGYVVIETTALDKWDDYLTNIVGAMAVSDVEGANGAGGAEKAAHYRIDARAFRFRIEQGSSEQLLAAAYRLDSAASLNTMAERISAAGQAVTMGNAEEAAVRGVEAFFRTVDTAGNGLEFYHGDSRTDEPFVSPVGVSGFVTGSLGMGHAVFNAPNFEETHRFYRDIVGFHDTDVPRFKFSPDPDDPGIGFAFMHADNGRHHSIAIGEGAVTPARCVHLMLEMQTLLDVGRCYDRMRLAKVPTSATLGCHTNDKMTSFYMQTPAGFDLEIGYDGLVIDPANWTTTAHTTISEWGHVWAWQAAMAESP